MGRGEVAKLNTSQSCTSHILLPFLMISIFRPESSAREVREFVWRGLFSHNNLMC